MHSTGWEGCMSSCFLHSQMQPLCCVYCDSNNWEAMETGPLTRVCCVHALWSTWEYCMCNTCEQLWSKETCPINPRDSVYIHYGLQERTACATHANNWQARKTVLKTYLIIYNMTACIVSVISKALKPQNWPLLNKYPPNSLCTYCLLPDVTQVMQMQQWRCPSVTAADHKVEI